MALNSINTNIAAYFAQQNINKANSMVSGSVGRLSSGNRIVRASDDVAAMSVGTSLRTTVSTLKVGLLNASQGTSMLQVADGALGKMQDMLLRQKALATQATSGSLTSAERGFLNQEFQNLTQEIDRLVQTTSFNGVNLLSGTLGNASGLADTDTIAAALATDGGVVATQVAIEAFDIDGGATAYTGALPTAAGEIALVDGEDAVLTNSQFETVNQSLFGEIGSFRMSNFESGVSATISVDINGVTYSATVADDAAAGSMTLVNGNTRIAFGYDGLDLTDTGSAAGAIQSLNASYEGFAFMQTATISGVNYEGTALEGVTGAAGSSAPMLRLDDMSDTSIKNFSYVGNNGANENTLSVEVGGTTFYATGLNDAVAAADVISFTDGNQNVLQLDLTGLTNGITDIRQEADDRASFINALNQAFANIGGGVDFALGTEASDKLTVSISKTDTMTLFGNQALNISTLADAQNAGAALNVAIDMVTSIRADVGAMMSRFDFATANIEIAMQNQDAARGTLLDTDVAAESSAYATAQVQLQAGIAVLAQANQLPQNLLKLIG